jgi:transposase InsO family protein
MWIDMYLGPPELIVHDAGSQFTSAEFIQKAEGVGSVTRCVPIEAHHSIGKVERYHRPLRRAFEIITKELP